MSKFIGVKMVEAVPMTAGDAAKKGYRTPVAESAMDLYIAGYEVTYEDGYKSWCPKDVFEKNNFELTDKNGESITKEDVENFIYTTHTIKVGRKTANVAVICRTGFEIHAQSTSVNADKFSLYTGGNIASSRALDNIQGFLEFVLQWAKNGISRKKALPTFLQNLLIEQKELEQKYNNLDEFINENPAFNTLDSKEQNRMKKQKELMHEYLIVLNERVETVLDKLDINK